MKVTYDDGKAETRTVTIAGGKIQTVALTYQRGAVNVDLAAAGTLSVNGKEFKLGAGGSIPVTGLSPGDYVFNVTYADGKTESRAVTVEGGKTLTVAFSYGRALGQLAKGAVLLTGIPSNVNGATLTNDANPSLSSDISLAFSDQFQIPDLDPNSTTTILLQANTDLKTPVSLTVQPKSGEVVTLPVPSGTFSFKSLPPETSVVLGGSTMTILPGDDGRLHSPSLLADGYDLILKSPYGADLTQAIAVTPGADTSIKLPTDYLTTIYTSARDKQLASWNRRGFDTTAGWVSFLTGVAAGLGAGLSYYLGTEAYALVKSSISESATTAAVQSVQLYADLFTVGIGVGGAGVGSSLLLWYLGSREPVRDDKAIKEFDQELAALRQSSGTAQ
jgi:hypothetical protein